MKYFCTYCNYSYDEAFWDEIEEIEAWTKIDFLDFCPCCLESDSFFPVEEEINYLDKNSNLPKDLEHFIEFKKTKDNKLKIIISENNHPMEKEHKIASVSIFDEYGDLVEERFLKDDFWEEIIFDNYDLDNFEIRIKCNKHGIFARKFENF